MSGRLPTVQILVLIGTAGASPQIGEISPLCDFLTVRPVLSFFSQERAQVERWTDFHALWLKGERLF